MDTDDILPHPLSCPPHPLPRRPQTGPQGQDMRWVTASEQTLGQSSCTRFGDICINEVYGSTEGNIGFINSTGKVGAVGKENFLHKMMIPYALIKYDTEKEEPIRDVRGLCIEVPRGQTGLLVGKISKRAPFLGYVRNKHQTERKKLKD
ncbi:hypothetical protein CRUP_025613, partial [Coryphaenoides rupestris]